MPRQARLDIPGALHHSMIRGTNKSAVFKSKQDKLCFLECLGDKIVRVKAIKAAAEWKEAR